jgi:hypothetical protein
MRRLALIAALALPVALPALEKASAEIERNRPTSSDEAVSLKPLFLFSMRGRPDPFMAYPLMSAHGNMQLSLRIEDLIFAGTIQMRGKTVALFSGGGKKTYFLRGNVLVDPEDKVVEGIRGSVLESSTGPKVVLIQGERKLTFTSARVSRRLEGVGQQ